MTTKAEKVRRAWANAQRPGADCKAELGMFHPSVDPHRCEGKGDCVEVCPHNVFEVGRMADEMFKALPVLAKLKVWAHGRKTAHTPNIDACQGCGLCVVACPEQAIRLVGPPSA